MSSKVLLLIVDALSPDALAGRLPRLNRDHLSRRVRTIFEAAEAAGHDAAAVNFPVCRGLRAHAFEMPRTLRIFGGAPPEEVVLGPKALFLGDLYASEP